MDAKIAPELAPLAVNLADLRPDPRNARVHSERNVAEVMASYRAHGQLKPIVVQRVTDDGTPMVVRAGNGQCEAARRLGWTEIAAVVIDERDQDAIAFALRDNRTAELAEWDREALGENLRVLSDGDYDMAALGWDGEEVLQLMNPAEVVNIDDDKPEKEVDVDAHKRTIHKVRPPVQMTNDDWQLHLGDCLEGLRKLADSSVDAVVTDPPAGIGFMGKGWDSDKGGRDKWIAWLQSIMAECLRVLKPGGHLLAWALPRTSHWTAMAIENAGFELRDVVYHAFGTGFPKSLDVGKAIDEMFGAERQAGGASNTTCPFLDRGVPCEGHQSESLNKHYHQAATRAATEQAQQWEGWGTALKPAVEPWIMARKPLEGTVAANVLKYGTGAINVAATRIGDEVRFSTPTGDQTNGTTPILSGAKNEGYYGKDVIGRWPAHFVMSHGAGCSPTACVLDCPIRIMNEQSGELTSGALKAGGKRGDGDGSSLKNGGGVLVRDWPGSTGGAARFFYCAKPARSETEAGLDDFEAHTGGEATGRSDGSDGLNSPRAGAGRNGGRKNIHPTKKSIALMRWLVRLVTPPGGTVLDAFAGSGTTGLAALVEGCRFIGFELSPEYHAIASARLRSIIEDPRGADDADEVGDELVKISEVDPALARPGRIEQSREVAVERSCLFPMCPHPARCEDRCVAKTSSTKEK